jgi:hypothetical protein
VATEYLIKAPVAEATCTVAGVAFIKGEARTSDEGALAYFRRHGYEVTEILPDPEPEPVEMPARTAKVDEWRTYAVAVGVDPEIAALLTAAQLATHYLGPVEPAKKEGDQK